MTPLSAQQHRGAEDAREQDRSEICVLLIEARAGTASVLRSLLSESSAARFTVLRTATIEAGIDAIGFGGVDVAVLGTEALLGDLPIDALLHAAQGLPIIALTSSEDPSVATSLIDEGFHDCVQASRISADALGWAAMRAIHRQRANGVAAAAPMSAPEVTAAGPTALAQRSAAQARTPLIALVDLLELLTSAWDALTDDHKLSMLSSIRSYATTVEQLTADLLTIAAIDADARGPVPQAVPVAGAVAAVATSHADLDVTVNIDPTLIAWVDPEHLRRMLTVLLAHADLRTDTPIEVSATNGGSSVRISIAGTGAAIDGTPAWSLLHAGAALQDDEGVALDVARRLAEANGGIAGVDGLSGSVWTRLPSSPPYIDLT